MIFTIIKKIKVKRGYKAKAIKAGLKNVVVVGDAAEDCFTLSICSGESVSISIFVASGEK